MAKAKKPNEIREETHKQMAAKYKADVATAFASYKATKEEWAKMLNDDFVCHQEGNVIMI